jgi:beta-lactamase regulating signal transducer with metallopeptidase domain
VLVDLPWRWGAGALLGWAALPLLVRLARRSRQGAPAAYHRALVTALGIATALCLAPLLRGVLGTAIQLPAAPPRPWPSVRSLLFVADWVGPMLGSAACPWPRLPFARALSALGVVWLSWFSLGVARALASRWRLAHAYRRAPLAPARVLECAAQVAAELGVAMPELRSAEDVAVAFTFGFFAPVVVLGRDVCGVGDAELEFVLRHELTHVARHDVRTALWIDVAQCCFGGHPSLRWLSTEIRFAREATVDAAAAGRRELEYADFLLGTAERLHGLRMPQSSLLSMADTALERRIKVLVAARRTSRSVPGVGSLALVGLVLGAVVLLAPSSLSQIPGADGTSQTRVDGNLSVEQVERVLFADPAPFQGCYARLPAPRPDLDVHLQFQIAENGRVREGQVHLRPSMLLGVSAFSLSELESCLDAALVGLAFPAPSSGSVQVDAFRALKPPLAERNARAAAQEGISQRLPPDVIRNVVRAQYAQFRVCYEAFSEPRPVTRATMKFTIGRDGKVVDGEIEATEFPALGKCMEPAMRSMVFPAPADGIVTVEYPVLFAPG